MNAKAKKQMREDVKAIFQIAKSFAQKQIDDGTDYKDPFVLVLNSVQQTQHLVSPEYMMFVDVKFRDESNHGVLPDRVIH